MRRDIVWGGMAVVCFGLLAAAPVHAQQLAKGTLSGTLFTAAATANAGSVPLYTAPATAKAGVAIITAVCGDVSTVNQTITGSTLGNLAIEAANGCHEFGTGGLPLPPGEILTYQNVGAFNASMRITGVISKK